MGKAGRRRCFGVKSPESMHEDLAQILTHLHANSSESHALTAGMTDEQLNWRPVAGKSWSILQCLEHVAISHGSYLNAMEPTLHARKADGPKRTGPITHTIPGTYFLKALAPPVGIKAPAPRSLIPSDGLTKHNVLEKLSATHDRVRTIVHEFGELDLNRIKFRNPFLPLLRVRVGTGLMIMCRHEERHLWQAENVRATLRAKK